MYLSKPATALPGAQEGTESALWMREPVYTDEHDNAIGKACEKLWNGEPAENPIHSPRPAKHPLRAYGNAALDASNAALAMRMQLIQAQGEITRLTARLQQSEREREALSHDYGVLLKRSDEFERERDEERKAHDEIARLCHVHRVTSDDGTSVGAVRALAAEYRTALTTIARAHEAKSPEGDCGCAYCEDLAAIRAARSPQQSEGGNDGR
jgi:hypothetical protein